MLRYIELNDKLHEGHKGFRIGRSCVDNISSLSELIHSCMKEGISTYIFFEILRKLMTQYGAMGYGIKHGKWALKVKCGEWLGLYM